MPEKQLCRHCEHEVEIETNEDNLSYFFKKKRLVHKGSGLVCTISGCDCREPEIKRD